MRLITIYICLLSTVFVYPQWMLAQHQTITYKKGEDLFKKTSQNLFIKIVTDKTTAYEGEAIRADYYLYVAVDLQGKMSKAPSYAGFASYEISKGSTNDYQIQQINGTTFKVYPVKSVQLFGLQPGISRIEPIKFDATIRYQLPSSDSENHEPFLPADTLYAFEIISKPVNISILPLPNQNHSEKTDLVGSFQVESSLNHPVIKKNQTDTLRVTIKGSGNWHNVRIPEIQFPDGVESFQPAISEWLDETEVPLKGVKVYAYPISANRSGSFTIPGVSLTYFNPESKRYEFTKTTPLNLIITETDYLAEKKKTSPLGSKKDYSKLFSKWVPIAFPIVALLLLISLFLYYQKNKKH